MRVSRIRCLLKTLDSLIICTCEIIFVASLATGWAE